MKKTPAHLDYLFERSIIDEEDYKDFWSQYWRAAAPARKKLVREYKQLALDLGDSGKVTGVVTKNRRDAASQAKIIGGRVVRRNARGQFSKRGHYYQAIKKTKHGTRNS